MPLCSEVQNWLPCHITSDTDKVDKLPAEDNRTLQKPFLQNQEDMGKGKKMNLTAVLVRKMHGTDFRRELNLPLLLLPLA